MRHYLRAAAVLCQGRCPPDRETGSSASRFTACYAKLRCRRGPALTGREDLASRRWAMASASYKAAGVDMAEADAGLRNIVKRLTATWPAPDMPGAVQLPIGYFANVIDIGGIGLGICTDGVGSKAIVAQLVNRYDTIGIDCV